MSGCGMPGRRWPRQGAGVAERFTFPIEEVRRAKRRAEEAARPGQGDGPVAGTLDPTPVLETFGCLNMKPGWKLFAYLAVAGAHPGLGSQVVAVPDHFDPAEARLEPVAARPRDADRPYVPDSGAAGGLLLPREARRRFMNAVEGDGTPWAYLCSSLAVRTLLGFAVLWHGLYAHDWGQHVILASYPPPRSRLVEPAWEHEGEEHELWRPAVWVGRSSVTVRFFTCRPAWADSEGVFRHDDLYQPGSCDPEVSRTRIAAGRPAPIES